MNFILFLRPPGAFTATLALVLAAVAQPAAACSTCACGDNSITVMGVEKPFTGRVRGALDFQVRTETKGEGATLQEIEEQRLSLGLSYSPSEIFTMALQLPFVRKHYEDATLAVIDTEGVGDADLIGRLVLYRDNPQLPRHMAGVRLGVRLPTSEQARDANWVPVNIDAQLDAGATAPNAGLWYAYYRLPVLVSISGAHLFYGEGRQGFRPGDATIATLLLQYGAGGWAFQAGADARTTEANRFSGVEDPNSGGTLVMGTLGLTRRFGTDFVLSAGVQIPAIRNLDGVQDEDTSFRAGMAYDF
jgi:hypothetical protein